MKHTSPRGCKRAKTLLGFLLFLILLLPGPSSGADSHDATLKEAASSLSACLRDREDLRIAVTGIRTLDGRSNGLTVWVAECLTSEFARFRGIHVLERGRLQEVIAENSLGFSDLFDPGRARELGKLLSADAVVNGTLTKTGKGFDLNLRVVDCEAGRILPGCAYRGEIGGGSGLMALWDQKGGLTVSVYPPDLAASIFLSGKQIGSTLPGRNVFSATAVNPGKQTLRVTAEAYPPYEQSVFLEPLVHHAVTVRLFRPLRVAFWQEDVESGRIVGNGGDIFTGRSYRFCFKANRDCHIYIFNHGTSGKVFPLVPNENLRQSNFVAAGEETKIPSVGGFPLKPPKGQETIYVIASAVPLTNLEEIARNILVDHGRHAAGFRKEVRRLREKSLTKDYGIPTEPALAESVSLNPDDGVVMQVTYTHK